MMTMSNMTLSRMRNAQPDGLRHARCRRKRKLLSEAWPRSGNRCAGDQERDQYKEAAFRWNGATSWPAAAAESSRNAHRFALLMDCFQLAAVRVGHEGGIVGRA